MRALQALVLLFLSALPVSAATFGTVVAHAQPISDLVLDDARRRIYLVNTASSQVEVYSTTFNPPRLTSTIKTDLTPLSAAIARNGRYLYVACYGASSLFIIDLTSTSFTARSVALAAGPEGVAVGLDEKVLISTVGTTTGQNILITFDPNATGSQALQSVVLTPTAPAVPALPAPGGVMALAGKAILRASLDGRTIVGVHNLANNTKTVFVYDVNSATVLGSRNLGAITPVLAVSADGSRFLAGSVLFESATLLVLGQQNTTNSPHTFQNVNFALQTTQGGAVFAPALGTAALIAAYNSPPVLSPAARSNASQLLVNSPDNLLIRLGIQLPETLSGKMAITSDNATIYAISQSGFIVLPIGALAQSPIGIPDANAAVLASDQCGITADQNSAVIPVRNIGGGRLTVTAQLLANSTTASTVRATSRTYGGDVTATISAAAARTLGTATPDQLLIQATEAVNIIPSVRIFQNSRNPESRGKIVPLDIGATNTVPADMTLDSQRQRLYIANPSLNRIEIFDMQQQKLLDPIPVGQLPRSLALTSDGNTLYVANSGSETISIVDLTKGVVTGRVNYPPIPFNAAFALLTPQIIANSQRGTHVLMSDGTLWKIVGSTLTPRTLNTNIFGTLRSLQAPQSMAASPDGSFVLVLGGTGTAYLYDASVDDFITSRAVVSAPITGYYGPISAAASGAFYLVNDQVLNQALTSIGTGSGTTGPVGGGTLPTPGGPAVSGRPVAAVAAINAQTYIRFSTAVRANAAATPADAGLIEVIDASSQRTTATAAALESPLAAAVGTARVNISGRTIAVDSTVQNAYILTASGISIIPLTPVTATAPQLSGSPVVNLANLTTAIAPGGLISILGRNLANTASAATTTLPTLLGSVCVTLNNAPIPLLSTSATQINAQIPTTLAAGRYPLIVRSLAAQAASGTATITVARYAPAIFLDPEGPAIFHKDGRRVDKKNPASRDEPLTIFLTGLGVTTGGRVTTGAPSPATPLAVTAPVSLFFGLPTIKESPVIVDWSGLMPGKIGVYQINARIPGTHVKGDALPVTVRIGGVDSPRTGTGAATVTVN